MSIRNRVARRLRIVRVIRAAAREVRLAEDQIASLASERARDGVKRSGEGPARPSGNDTKVSHPPAGATTWVGHAPDLKPGLKLGLKPGLKLGLRVTSTEQSKEFRAMLESLRRPMAEMMEKINVLIEAETRERLGRAYTQMRTGSPHSLAPVAPPESPAPPDPTSPSA